MKGKFSPDVVRSFVFGVEDSIVSTVGLVSGVAAAGIGNATVLLTGTVLVFVEAFSMAVGTFLSDTSALEFQKQGDVPLRPAIGSSVIMFVSYVVCGLIVLVPYALLKDGGAMPLSIILSFAVLFSLGVLNARISKGRPFRKGAFTALIGGIAILLGILVGRAFK